MRFAAGRAFHAGATWQVMYLLGVGSMSGAHAD